LLSVAVLFTGPTNSVKAQKDLSQLTILDNTFLRSVVVVVDGLILYCTGRVLVTV